MSDILQLINDKCRERLKLEAEKETLAAMTKAKNLEIAEADKFIMDALQAQNMKGLDTEFGKFAVKVESYATIKDRDKLYAWLKEKGIFDSLVTISAATMNSFFKQEEEKAMEAQDLDFEIPGMEATSQRTKLSITGKKTYKLGESK